MTVRHSKPILKFGVPRLKFFLVVKCSLVPVSLLAQPPLEVFECNVEVTHVLLQRDILVHQRKYALLSASVELNLELLELAQSVLVLTLLFLQTRLVLVPPLVNLFLEETHRLQ